MLQAPAHIPLHEIKQVSFVPYSEANVEKLSVKEIRNPETFDALGHPNPGGLHDPALGPTKWNDVCVTCGLSGTHCPGHYGHLTLPVLVYNPALFKVLYALLRGTCLECKHLICSPADALFLKARCVAFALGNSDLSNELSRIIEATSESANTIANDAELDEGTKKRKRKKDERTEADFATVHFWVETAFRNAKVPYDFSPLFRCGIDGEDDIRLAGSRFTRDKLVSRRKGNCAHCGKPLKQIRQQHSVEFIYMRGEDQETSGTGPGGTRAARRRSRDDEDDSDNESSKSNRGVNGRVISAYQVREVVEKLFQEDVVMMRVLLGGVSADAFFVRQLLVTPNRFRPVSRLASVLCESHLTQQYRRILKQSTLFRALVAELRSLLRKPGLDRKRAELEDGGMSTPSPISRHKGILKKAADQDAAGGGENEVEPDWNAIMSDEALLVTADERLKQSNNTLSRKSVTFDQSIDASESTPTPTGKKESFRGKPASRNEAADAASSTPVLSGISGRTVSEKVHLAASQLQTYVSALLDANLDRTTLVRDRYRGLKQVLDRKAGLLRMHMMGKRVDMAARTVISPDVNLEVDEIGIPLIFARRLVLTESVTPHNVNFLAQLVRAGPSNYPGAEFVELENGARVKLSASNKTQRNAIAQQLLVTSSNSASNNAGGALAAAQTQTYGTKKVIRHLLPGDTVLMNRQPTLHRPSIQAHRARVLPSDKTLRLHYSTCKAYNADYDGDEMNAHFPQSLNARAESAQLLAVSKQYLVPKDATPLGGLIQDHIVSSCLLTMRDRFLSRADYDMLVYVALCATRTDAMSHSADARASAASVFSTNYRRGSVELLAPAIRRPTVFWTGKQVISTVILNVIPPSKSALNLRGRSKVPAKLWFQLAQAYKANAKRDRERRRKRKHDQAEAEALAEQTPSQPAKEKDGALNEAEIVIEDGELLSGLIDKAHIGSSSYGLVHACYELYGGEVACRLLSALSRLLTTFLQLAGFSIGIQDLLLRSEAERRRRRTIEDFEQRLSTADLLRDALRDSVSEEALRGVDERAASELLRRSHSAHLGLSGSGKRRADASVMRDAETEARLLEQIELAAKERSNSCQNQLTEACVPGGLLKPFPANAMQLTIISGAKGSGVNAMQISCLVGQIELEGHRPPLMVSGRTLPCFAAFRETARSGGFVTDRFLTGLRRPEFFYHAMAGREGLIDTAVKTSRSGYLQRCLVKHLEALVVAYDATVRNVSDQQVVQFAYGEDGLDVTRTSLINDANSLASLVRNADLLLDNFAAVRGVLCNESVTRSIDKHRRRLARAKHLEAAANAKPVHHRPGKTITPAATGLPAFWQLESETKAETEAESGQEWSKDSLVTEWFRRKREEPERLGKVRALFSFSEPCATRFRPDVYYSSVSERFEALMDSYLDANPDRMVATESDASSSSRGGRQLTVEQFKNAVYLRYSQSFAEPGESIGVLAAQSIGEPSTQMTLNTFHFAGRGEMNVTLGIPRLRELLMTASHAISTPWLEVPLIDQSPECRARAEALVRRFSTVLFRQTVKSINFTDSVCLRPSINASVGQFIKMRFRLRKNSVLKREFGLTAQRVIRFIETRFLRFLVGQLERRVLAYGRANALRSLTFSKLEETRRAMLSQSAGEGSGDGEEAESRKQDAETDEKDDDDAESVATDNDSDDELDNVRRGRGRSQSDAETENSNMSDVKYDTKHDEDDEDSRDADTSASSSQKKPRTSAASDSDSELDDDQMDVDAADDVKPERPIEVDDSEDEVALPAGAASGDEASSDLEARIAAVLDSCERASRGTGRSKYSVTLEKYSVDDKKRQCEATLRVPLFDSRLDVVSWIEAEVARAALLSESGVKRAFLTEKRMSDGSRAVVFKTEGVNLAAIERHSDVLDMARAYTNDVQQVAAHWGIEAAYSFLIAEVRSVFAAYGIDVNYRHLSLLADYMTVSGRVLGFNRMSMSQACASLLQKASFETCSRVLVDGVSHAESDPLTSTSARLVVGRLVPNGTGYCQLMTQLNVDETTASAR